MIVSPELNHSYHLLYQGDTYGDADIQVQVAMAPGGDPTQPGGLIFWGTDGNNFYCLNVTQDGKVTVYRHAGNRWLIPVPKTPNDAVKKGAGEFNTLRVVTKGRQATCYVNGKQVAQVTGQPPSGGGEIGLYGESGEKQTAVWQFAALKVTSVE